MASVRPHAALVERRQPFAAWPGVTGWLLLPASSASLPLPHRLSQVGRSRLPAPCHSLVTAAMRRGEAKDRAHTWALPGYLERREAKRAGGPEELAVALPGQGCVPSQHWVLPGTPSRPRCLAGLLVHAVQRPLSFVPPLRAGSGRVS